jgi:hypothetical protein
MQALLQQVALKSRFIYEAAYVDGHRPAPTAAAAGHRALACAGHQGPTYSYWLNTTTEPNENLAALMLGRGNFWCRPRAAI